MYNHQLKSPYFLALDVDTAEEALLLARSTKNYVGGFKVGPRLSLKYGGHLISQLSELAPVFLDNKFYDIPNTMLHSVRASFYSGASFVTVHASSGHEALSLLAVLEKELNTIRPFSILSVTILTSFTQETLPPHYSGESIDVQVEKLVELVLKSGLRGIVCSPQELSSLVHKFPQANFITPGIRKSSDEHGDQKRVMGPCEAIAAGASALVVGRPIYQNSDPVKAARGYYDDLSKIS